MQQVTYDMLLTQPTTIQATHKVKSMNKTTVQNLSQAEVGKEYIIEDVVTKDKDIMNFLSTLGCFRGESVTVISVLSENFVITIKDARYSIDAELASAIILS